MFLDLKKAFDTVNHQILVRKLGSIGLSPESVRWCASYLENRKQITKVGNTCSSEQFVRHGVPQGSILGPLFFLVFINDLCQTIELCGTSMYADDTAIFYLCKDLDELKVSIQFDLQSVAHWMRENRLSLNVGKTKFMMVGSRNRLSMVPEISVSLNGELIDNVTVFKYLGMLLDNHLQFHPHIDKLVDKTSSKLSLLYKTRWLFDQNTALMLYKALITPHFNFGSVVYEVAPQNQLQRLQIIQNAAARLILLEDPKCPVYQLHEALKLDTLATRRSKAMVKLTYNCIHDKQPDYLCEQLKSLDYGGRHTRATDSGILSVPRTSTQYGRHAYSFRGPMQWNVTAAELKAAVNKEQLKRLLKTSWYQAGNG